LENRLRRHLPGSVSCSNNSAGVIIVLNLTSLSLTGQFSEALCSLRSLECLDLNFNDFMGPLPACP
jgi:hypothetical protein